MKIAMAAGNPKPASRTLEAAVLLGAGPAHAMAEPGALCPFPGRCLIDRNFAEGLRLQAYASRASLYLPLIKNEATP